MNLKQAISEARVQARKEKTTRKDWLEIWIPKTISEYVKNNSTITLDDVNTAKQYNYNIEGLAYVPSRNGYYITYKQTNDDGSDEQYTTQIMVKLQAIKQYINILQDNTKNINTLRMFRRFINGKDVDVTGRVNTFLYK